jgi:hypothetical protein
MVGCVVLGDKLGSVSMVLGETVGLAVGFTVGSFDGSAFGFMVGLDEG